MDPKRSESTFRGSLNSSRSLPNIEKTSLEPPELRIPDPESSAKHESSASGEAALDRTGLGFNLNQKEGRVPKSSRTYGDGYGFRYFGDDERHEEDYDKPKEEYEVHWDGENDPMHPRSMSKARKWLVVWIVSFSSACVTCTSSMYTSTYQQLTPEFHSSYIVATLGLSLFVMGLGIGPMVLGPLSEFYGRRPIYLVSLLFFVIWLIPCAVAPNIQTMLVARLLDGVAGSAFLSVAGGTVGDMFARHELQAPMMIFTASPFVGPPIGPIVGGFINYFTHWRWTFYVLLIWSAFMLATIAAFVPETYHPVVLRHKAAKTRKETVNENWKAPIERLDRSIPKTIMRSCYRPFLLLTLEPMCLLLCIFSAILLGVLYLFFGAFELVFENNHHFNLWQTGLSFTGLFVGICAAIATLPLWHRNYVRLVQNRQKDGGEVGGAEPEYRLPPAIAGAIICPIGLLWFGWTTYSSVYWLVPIVGSAIFGCGMLLVFSGVFTFLVDAYPLYAASALAANSFARSGFAAAFPLFGNQMYNKLGYQWATTLLASLTLAMAPFPYLFFVYGKRIRGMSKFAAGR